MLIEVERPDAPKPIQLVGNPVKFSAAPEGPVRPFPRLGEHTAEVLQTELALSDAKVEALAIDGTNRLGGAAFEQTWVNQA
jgi:crotonobetainyl-CoA:carnitine CoA-transferase CaiB-like acyl-CoA transferase